MTKNYTHVNHYTFVSSADKLEIQRLNLSSVLTQRPIRSFAASRPYGDSMSLLPYRPSQFTREGQAYIRLRERCEKLAADVECLRTARAEAHGNGVKAAAQFAGERLDAECSSKYHIEDLVLAKFNLSDRKRPRVKKPGKQVSGSVRAKRVQKVRSCL